MTLVHVFKLSGILKKGAATDSAYALSPHSTFWRSVSASTEDSFLSVEVTIMTLSQLKYSLTAEAQTGCKLHLND